MTDAQLTLITKPGCHLCDDARTVLDEVLSSVAVTQLDLTLTVTERNMLENDELLRYSEEIPVLLINDRMHSYWHIDRDRLVQALQKLSAATTPERTA